MQKKRNKYVKNHPCPWIGILGCVSLRSMYVRYLRTVLTYCYSATVRGYVLYVQTNMPKTYGLPNPVDFLTLRTPIGGVRRSTYSFLLYAHPYVHVDSLWKWCTTPRRFTYDLGAFWSVTYYLGLVRGVADVSGKHPWSHWCSITVLWNDIHSTESVCKT